MKKYLFYGLTTMMILLTGGAIVFAEVFGVDQGGTNASIFSGNSIIVSDSAGTTLLATSTQPLYVGSLYATTTATSTFGGGIDSSGLVAGSYFYADGAATSTFTNGLNLIDGCFAIAGTCLDTSGGHDAVTLAGSYDYLTLSGQQITLNQIDLTTDVTGTLPYTNGGTGTSTPAVLGDVLYWNGTGWQGVATSSLGISGGGGTPGGSDSYVQYNNGGSFGGEALFVWDDTNKRLGIGTSSPYAMLSVAGLGVFNNIYATSTTATSTFAGNLVASGSRTEIDNLYTGPQYFDTDAGIVSWIDVPVTSSLADNTVVSYTAGIDGNSILTVYGQSDGAGGADTFRIGIGTTTPYSKLSVAGQVAAQNFVATSTTANTFGGALLPLTSDVAALGSSSFMWSDLFVASGAVLNFNNGDVTLTHSSNTLTIGGGDLALGTNAISTGGEIQLDGTPNTDHTAVGSVTSTFNAGTTVTIMDLVYMATDGEWGIADADDTATSTSMLAISLAAGTDGNPMKVALPNSFVRDDTWNWTPGSVLYVSTTAGQITATAPSGTDDVVRVVGQAVTADVIHFNPSQDWLTVN